MKLHGCSQSVQPPDSFVGYAHYLRSPRQVKPARYTMNIKNPTVRRLLSLFLANRQTLNENIRGRFASQRLSAIV
jgi:hypothetical protein